MDAITTLTFLNTTGTPAPSRDKAKLVRGHVTKVNFAKRRAKALKAGSSGGLPKVESQLPNDVNPETRSAMLPHVPRREGHRRITANLPAERTATTNELGPVLGIKPLFFIEGTSYDGNSYQQQAWVKFVSSEPAFKEATISLGLRHWSPDGLCEKAAEAHLYRVLQTLIQRINCRQAYTDGTLGAVLTLAFGERLICNEMTWGVHISGVSQIISERRFQGLPPVPKWVSSLLISDSINHIMKYPRFYHDRVIDAVGFHGNETLCEVADIANNIMRFRDTARDSRNDIMDQAWLLESTKNTLRELHKKVRGLRDHPDLDVQASSLSMTLLLHLSWPPEEKVNLANIARELRDTLSRRAIQPCPHADLTSGQFMVGAIAAEEDPEVKDWFVGRWKQAVSSMRIRGWPNPVEMIERGLSCDPKLLERFRLVWTDVDTG